jgi:hypothetical protein
MANDGKHCSCTVFGHLMQVETVTFCNTYRVNDPATGGRSAVLMAGGGAVYRALNSL